MICNYEVVLIHFRCDQKSIKPTITDHVSDHVATYVSDRVTEHVSDSVTTHVSDRVTEQKSSSDIGSITKSGVNTVHVSSSKSVLANIERLSKQLNNTHIKPVHRNGNY